MKSLLAVLLLAVGSTAWAECACFCADGELRTMCTTVGEAQANPTMCATYQGVACPVESAGAASYDAPEGAVDCRSMRVWDTAADSFADVAVCDVLESGS